MRITSVSAARKMKNDWDVDAAIATYNVDGWGGGYFTVNAEGNVVAKPLQENGGTINLLEGVNEARPRGRERSACARPEFSARHPVSGFAPASRRVGEPRFSKRDHRIWLWRRS